MQTYDFTTMYTAIEHKRMLLNVRKALEDAEEFERSKFLNLAAPLRLTLDGWSTDPDTLALERMVD